MNERAVCPDCSGHLRHVEGCPSLRRSKRTSERRVESRRKWDRALAISERAVIGAADRWYDAMIGGSSDERLAAQHNLNDAVGLLRRTRDGLNDFFGADGAAAVSVLSWVAVLVLLLLPSTVVPFGSWLRWLTAMAALLLLAGILWRDNRDDA